MEAIDRSWLTYSATTMTVEEKKLTNGFTLLRSNSQVAIDTLVEIVSRKDQSSLEAFVRQ